MSDAGETPPDEDSPSTRARLEREARAHAARLRDARPPEPRERSTG